MALHCQWEKTKIHKKNFETNYDPAFAYTSCFVHASLPGPSPHLHATDRWKQVEVVMFPPTPIPTLCSANELYMYSLYLKGVPHVPSFSAR